MQLLRGGSLNQEPLGGQQAAKVPSWFENAELKCLCISSAGAQLELFLAKLQMPDLSEL